MRSRSAAVGGAVLLSAALLMAGCAESNEPEPPGAPESSAPASSQPAEDATPTEGTLTLRGKVAEGVEAGCLLLRADGKEYLLVGARDVQPGTEVEVTGQVTKEVSSFCQQGTPFMVAELRVP